MLLNSFSLLVWFYQINKLTLTIDAALHSWDTHAACRADV